MDQRGRPQFPEVTRERWEAELARLGTPIDTLRTPSGEGPIVAPLYEPQVIAARPRRARPGWRLHQRLASLDPAAIGEAVAHGVDALVWRGDVDPAALAAAHAALGERAKLWIETERADAEAWDRWKRAGGVGRGALVVDPIGAWVRGGTRSRAIDPELGHALQCVTWAPGSVALLVDGSAWHDAGASACDELAFAIAATLALWDRAAAAGVPLSILGSATIVRVGLGGDVLIDLAKLRALRSLLAGAAASLGVTAVPTIVARTCARLRPAHDPDTNMIRASVEVFTGATAGADVVEVDPRRDVAEPQGVHAARWARNLSHVLRLESGLGDVEDPWAGAAAIETLTAELGAAAWELARGWQASGGLLAALERGEPQARARDTARTRIAEITAGTRVVIGVNRHRPSDASTTGAPPPEPTHDGDPLVPIDLGAIVPA